LQEGNEKGRPFENYLALLKKKFFLELRETLNPTFRIQQIKEGKNTHIIKTKKTFTERLAD
jgi:hypothetical protein